MQIRINQKFRPFSHIPGTRCLVPHTSWEVQVFPAKLFFHNLIGGEEKEVDLNIKGPVQDFTVLQDLEKGRIEIFGTGLNGYFRYLLPSDQYPFLLKKIGSSLLKKKKLSLGVHKKQDWDLIQRRGDMAEIFPLWCALSQIIPDPRVPIPDIGTKLLLNEGNLALTFQSAFQGILCPRLKDENYLGIIPDIQVSKTLCPLGILHEGAKRIESLFFAQEEENWVFLPNLPPQFHAGRFIHLNTLEGDEIHFEWSKKELKKVIIFPNRSRKIQLKLPKRLLSYRIRNHLTQKGERGSKTLFLEKNQIFYLDRFNR